ncbi:MAG TPA: CapA family protein [Actinomycetota bacterium]|nr:CapA family protein [Actinomycetota bacterium]
MRLALAGDTMLGRGVARALAAGPPERLVAPEVVELMGTADLVVLNLECCVSERGRRWDAPGKPFFFRAPPSAVDLLRRLRVGCVTLANNHALDYGREALLDTLDHLAGAGIAAVGAGRDLDQARRPAVLDAAGLRVAVIGVTDHPADYAARPDRPGVAYADLAGGAPEWLLAAVRDAAAHADAVLVTPHWGPNMTQTPVPHVRQAAAALGGAGATLVAGHSAHVPHGVGGRVLYDLGDFLDDYAVDRRLRNDLGLLFLVTVDEGGPVALEAVPLKLDFCRTRLADGSDAAWMRRRFRDACAALGTDVAEAGGRLVVTWR